MHDYTRLMRQSLLNLFELQEDIDKLRADKAVLKEDLQKREEAPQAPAGPDAETEGSCTVKVEPFALCALTRMVPPISSQ